MQIRKFDIGGNEHEHIDEGKDKDEDEDNDDNYFAKIHCIF